MVDNQVQLLMLSAFKQWCGLLEWVMLRYPPRMVVVSLLHPPLCSSGVWITQARGRQQTNRIEIA